MNEFLDRVSKLSPKRLALLALELHNRLQAVEARAAEPIAIVGMGCRYPGADGPDEFWNILRQGIDAVDQIPPNRWNVDAYYDAAADAPGRMVSKWGSFLNDVDKFDARFFGIAPREALNLDPQQRLLLEVSWQALEHAGMSADNLIGTSTGVFVSVGGLDYYHRILSNGMQAIDAYAVSGNAPSMAAGRLAYFLGLQGPALTVDTACSSSLVAVHLACQSLRVAECRMALAGAANLLLSPETAIGLSQAHMLSPTGRCRTFDAGADGIVRGEGSGIVVLKRLTDARADGDRVLAVIRGTAINQDGRSSGITAPNGPAQEAVIREALQRSEVAPADIDYVEAHGTGTPLGDPIEVRALANVFGGDRTNRLLIGSVKTNFGHLEMAAGIAGLMKVVLSLEHGEIPPHLHVAQPSTYIEWETTPVEVVSTLRPWRRGKRVRRAGVSCFGFSGTNAHAVVEEAPAEAPVQRGVERPSHILAFSARNAQALGALAERYHRHLETAPPESIADVCFTANSGRAHFAVRAAVTAGTRDEMIEALSRFASGQTPGVYRGRTSDGRAPEVAFLFTGQGSQSVGMGRELYETQPTFRRALEECDRLLLPYLQRSLLSVIYPAPDAEADAEQLLASTVYTQPALFAVEYALATLWRSWGVQPSIVAGHSVGEYVAACVAGILTLGDALALISTRARLMGALPAGGAMASLFCEEARVVEALAHAADAVSVAALNGPAHVVISGTAAGVDSVVEWLHRSGVPATRLRVSHAFHSALIDPMLERFEQDIAHVTSSAPQVTFISNVTGRPLSATDRLGPRYWRDHARNPVRFSDAVTVAYEQGCRMFVEIGPHPVLLGMGRDCVSDTAVQWLPSLRRNTSDTEQMLSSLGQLYVAGGRIDWRAFDRDYQRRKVSLPTYPFQRESFWIVGESPEPAAKTEPWRDWLYTDEWKQLPAGDGRPRTAGDLAALARSESMELLDHHGATPYLDLYPALDLLANAYALQALQRLGWSPTTRPRFTSAELRRVLRVRDTHERLFDRLLQILAEDGVLQRTDDGWMVVSMPATVDPDAMAEAFMGQLPMCRGELSTTVRCGARLADVLTGHCDPMDLLFPGGSLETAEELYERAPSMRVFNDLVARTVDRVASDRKDVSVLEIGAGTGATTAAVLGALPSGARYVFTDVSSAFTARARTKFAEYGNIEYRLLDIEVDPALQGLGEDRFDIVIASNCLHATVSLHTTLTHARALLKPGGLLVLVEAVGRQRFGDLTVGLTSGWWRFTDVNLRPDYALLTTQQWMDTLEHAGFENVSACPNPGMFSSGLFANQTLLLAQSPQRETETLNTKRHSWLVFADRGGIAAAIATVLRGRDEECILVHPGQTYRDSGLSVEIDPHQPEHYTQVLARPAARGSTRAILNCWPLDADYPPNADLSQVVTAVEWAGRTALELVKAVASQSEAGSARLFVLTSGAQGSDPILADGAAAQATLVGFARTVAIEHPELRCTMVDLPAVPTTTDLSGIAERIGSAPEQERELVFRNGSLFGRRIVRRGPAQQSSSALIRSRVTYMVTGGLAGLGLCVAEWLADRGAEHLVLVGRSRPTDAAVTVIEGLRARGVDVLEVQADVSSANGVDAALATVPASAPLAGVFHLAGSLDDGLLLQQSWDRFDRVMAAKIRGSWLLHTRTATLTLDHFVLFSSGASFIGSPGQSNHAAANAFMDTLARVRRVRGLPALSINWGAWREIGAATRGNVVNRARSYGLGAMSTKDALAALEHVMGRPEGQVAVMPIDWSAMLRERPDDQSMAAFRVGRSPRHDHEASGNEPSGVALSESEDPTAWLNKVGPGRLRGALEDIVLGEVARVLGLAASQVDRQQPLRDAGLDSLMAVELRNTLSRRIGTRLAASALFSYPTIDELIEHVIALLGADSPRESDPVNREPAVSPTPLDDLSEDELAVMLAGKLRVPAGPGREIDS